MNRKRMLVLVMGLSLIGLAACEESNEKANNYTLKDVTVEKKEVAEEYRDTDYFILIQKGDRKARIELSKDNYERIVEGQHIDVEVNATTGVLEEYQINLGETEKVEGEENIDKSNEQINKNEKQKDDTNEN